VITLFLKPECAEQCNRFFGQNAIQKAVNDDLVEYVVYESRKRSALLEKGNSLVTLVCHTTAEAMWYYKRAQCVEAVQERVLRKYLQLSAQVAGRVVRRAHSRCWGKCQVTKSISEALGRETTHCESNPTDSPPLALCGDYFLGPNCTDAVVSAAAAGEAVACSLTGHARSADCKTTSPGDGEAPSSGQQQEKHDPGDNIRRRWRRKVES
jgi:hypothetical protein